jgi:hypothetical protein
MFVPKGLMQHVKYYQSPSPDEDPGSSGCYLLHRSSSTPLSTNHLQRVIQTKPSQDTPDLWDTTTMEPSTSTMLKNRTFGTQKECRRDGMCLLWITHSSPTATTACISCICSPESQLSFADFPLTMHRIRSLVCLWSTTATVQMCTWWPNVSVKRGTDHAMVWGDTEGLETELPPPWLLQDDQKRFELPYEESKRVLLDCTIGFPPERIGAILEDYSERFINKSTVTIHWREEVSHMYGILKEAMNSSNVNVPCSRDWCPNVLSVNKMW